MSLTVGGSTSPAAEQGLALVRAPFVWAEHVWHAVLSLSAVAPEARARPPIPSARQEVVFRVARADRSAVRGLRRVLPALRAPPAINARLVVRLDRLAVGMRATSAPTSVPAARVCIAVRPD